MKTNLALIAIACLGLSACSTVPNGQKNGTITKLAQEGVINKTWEAEIVRGGSFTGGTGVQGASFDFTITDPALLEQVRQAFDQQLEVRITYHKEAFCPFSSGNDCHFLDKIQVVSEAEGGTQGRNGTSTTPTTTDNDAKFQALLEQNNAILKQNQALLDKLTK